MKLRMKLFLAILFLSVFLLSCSQKSNSANYEVVRCNSFVKPEAKDSCYVSAAFNSNNAEICSMINSSYNKGQCYEGLAFKNKDSALCNNIPNNNAALSCRNNINNFKNTANIKK